MIDLKRRDFLKHAAAAASAPAFFPFRAFGARNPSYAQEMPDMLVAYLAGRQNKLYDKWQAVRDAIKTPAELEARNRFVREKMREMVGGIPRQTNGLNAVVVASHERKGYRVENVMFESMPSFWVTGNLYVPTTGKGPFPGIISPCGHYPNSRMEPEYQFAYMNMVLNGFVVFAYDPIGQGERRQYWNPDTGKTEVATASTYEHSMPGQVLLLLGENLTHYLVWDGMRAVDYLLTRPEVDKTKIGCAGHSGGGTMTRFIACVDDRIKCAVINEGGVGHRWPARLGRGGRLGPSDVEQNIFPSALYGVDGCDMVVAFAPRPMLATIENFGGDFDVAAEHIKSRYQLLGVPEKFAVEEAADPHSWTVKLRLASTDWFSRWFYGKRGPDREPDFEPEPMKNLYCTPDGSILKDRKGETIYTIIEKKGETATPARKVPGSASELASFRRELAGEILKLTKCDKPEAPLGTRLIVTTPRKGYKVEKLEFLSEPGIYIPTWVFVPEKRNSKPAILWVSEAGKEAEGKEFERLEKLTREGNLIIAVDIRGIGETAPQHASDRSGPYSHLFDAETAMTYMTWFMDESLFGMRVRDVMRCVDYAYSRPDIGGPGLRVVGKGQGALWVMYAAALDPRITETIAQNGLVSYKSLTKVDRYLHGADVCIRGVLLRYDLPHVAAAVGGRQLTLVEPVDPMKNGVPLDQARQAYDFTAQAFRNAGAGDKFRIVESIEL